MVVLLQNEKGNQMRITFVADIYQTDDNEYDVVYIDGEVATFEGVTIISCKKGGKH